MLTNKRKLAISVRTREGIQVAASGFTESAALRLLRRFGFRSKLLHQGAWRKTFQSELLHIKEKKKE